MRRHTRHASGRRNVDRVLWMTGDCSRRQIDRRGRIRHVATAPGARRLAAGGNRMRRERRRDTTPRSEWWQHNRMRWMGRRDWTTVTRIDWTLWRIIDRWRWVRHIATTPDSGRRSTRRDWMRGVRGRDTAPGSERWPSRRDWMRGVRRCNAAPGSERRHRRQRIADAQPRIDDRNQCQMCRHFLISQAGLPADPAGAGTFNDSELELEDQNAKPMTA